MGVTEQSGIKCSLVKTQLHLSKPLNIQARRAGANNFPDVAGEVLGAVNALLLKHGVDCAPPLSLGVR